MTPREKGFLLLRSTLGDPSRKPLTTAQYRTLAARVRAMRQPVASRELELEDLLALGYDRVFSQHILTLLSQEDWLDEYIRAGKRNGCVPITRVTPSYPPLVIHRLGWDSPACFWVKGDVALLNTPAISLVGSRELREENRQFAEAVGYEAAKAGLTLISGNARGADRTAQNACLSAGGKVISILADELTAHEPQENQLLLSEEEFNAPFTKQRALNRNKSIHAMGPMVFVAQAEAHKGGTWDGTVKNLSSGWSEVFCFRDGSSSSLELEQMGAWLISPDDLPGMKQLSKSD